MILYKNQKIIVNGKNGIDIRKDTKICAWGQKEIMSIEPPFRCEGGEMQIEKLGGFTFFNVNPYARYVKSIGRFCSIAQDVVIGPPEHPTKMLSHNNIFQNADSEWETPFCSLGEAYSSIIQNREACKKEMENKKKIVIGNDVWIGMKVIILRGVTIGDGAIIAAGSIVTKDVLPYSIVGGVPARIIRFRFKKDIINKLLDIRWWEYGPDILKGLDISKINETVKVIYERIEKGMEKYCVPLIKIDNNSEQIWVEM